jgi:replicative DNA helicase
MTREIEQSILKKCLYSQEHLARVIKIGCIFYYGEHIELFNLLKHCYKQDRKVDAMLLSDMILGSELKYLTNSYVAEMKSPVANDLFDEYLKKVTESYIMRTLDFEFNKNKTCSPTELLYHLTEKLTSMQASCTEITTQEYCVNQAKECQTPPVDQFVPTGQTFFDETCGGFANTDLIVFVARPGCGKTHTMINLMEYMSRHVPIGCWSMEEPADMVFKKMACSVLGIDTIQMRRGTLSNVEKSNLATFLGKLHDRTIVIDEEAELYAEDMLSKALAMKNKYGIRALFVDYLQFAESRSSDKERMQIKHITKVLKLVAKELKIPVIALAQADRGLDTADGKPHMKDIYGGSYIEKTADLVIFQVPSIVDAQEAAKHLWRLTYWVLKHKNGPVGSYNRRWQKNHAKIKEF